MKVKELTTQVIWQKILAQLSMVYSEPILKETFANVKIPYQIENNVLFILVENDFLKKKIKRIYFTKIEEIASDILKTKIILKIITIFEMSREDKDLETSLEKDKTEKRISFNNYLQGQLEPNYLFDNFVLGSSNIFAFKMAKKIAETEKVTTNPLYIFGPFGLGKTHLMQSIGNYILKKNPHKKVLYVKADGFIEDFTNQLRKEKMEDFNNKYRNIDVLLTDDIQIMIEAKRTQMEFFKLFDYLNLNKKQIVITSDKSIEELHGIMERLNNRFKAGLIVDIRKPDTKHCLDILKRKILEMKGVNFKIKKEILEFIASHFGNNIREMEGALLRFFNYIEIYDLEINLQNTIIALEPLLKNKKNTFSEEESTIEKIKNIVTSFYNISIRDLISKKKHYKYTLPRHITIYLMKSIGGFSYKKISFILRLQYSSVLKCFKKMQKKIDENAELKRVIDIIINKIHNLPNIS